MDNEPDMPDDRSLCSSEESVMTDPFIPPMSEERDREILEFRRQRYERDSAWVAQRIKDNKKQLKRERRPLGLPLEKNWDLKARHTGLARNFDRITGSHRLKKKLVPAWMAYGLTEAQYKAEYQKKQDLIEKEIEVNKKYRKWFETYHRRRRRQNERRGQQRAMKRAEEETTTALESAKASTPKKWPMRRRRRTS